VVKSIGFVRRSWNNWIDANGGEGNVELDGIKVRKINSPVDLAVCCSDTEASEKQRLRKHVINQRVAQTKLEIRLHKAWLEEANDLIREIYIILFTVERIARQYFDNHSFLFNWDTKALNFIVKEMEECVGEYNRRCKDLDDFILDLTEIRASVDAVGQREVKFFTTCAKADTLEALGDHRAANSLRLRALDMLPKLKNRRP
jgi:hypothetical protein